MSQECGVRLSLMAQSVRLVNPTGANCTLFTDALKTYMDLFAINSIKTKPKTKGVV